MIVAEVIVAEESWQRTAIPGQQNFAEKTGFLEEPFVKFG